MSRQPPIYALMAEFTGADALIQAVRRTREAGYRFIDAFTPFPVEGLSEAIGHRPTRIPLIVLAGGIIGGLTGYLLQYHASVLAYPLNVGGRPLHSWPSFIPVTFETTVLAAALSAVIGMLALNGLPKPYHPVFNVPQFARASQDRFFLIIEARDPRFDPAQTRAFLKSLHPAEVLEVEP